MKRIFGFKLTSAGIVVGFIAIIAAVGIITGAYLTKPKAVIDEVEIKRVAMPSPIIGDLIHVCMNGEVKVVRERPIEKYCLGENVFIFQGADKNKRELYRVMQLANDTLGGMNPILIQRVGRLSSVTPSNHDPIIVDIGTLDELSFTEVIGKTFVIDSSGLVREVDIPDSHARLYWNPSVTRSIINASGCEGDCVQSILGYDLKSDAKLRVIVKNAVLKGFDNGTTREEIYELKLIRWMNDDTAEFEFTDSNGRVQKGEVSFVSE